MMFTVALKSGFFSEESIKTPFMLVCAFPVTTILNKKNANINLAEIDSKCIFQKLSRENRSVWLNIMLKFPGYIFPKMQYVPTIVNNTKLAHFPGLILQFPMGMNYIVLFVAVV